MNIIKVAAVATLAFWLLDSILFNGSNFDAISTMLGLILTGMTRAVRL